MKIGGDGGCEGTEGWYILIAFDADGVCMLIGICDLIWGDSWLRRGLLS